MANDEFIAKPELPDLPKVKDRMSFIYLEHCNINREDGAIRIEDLNGITNIPAAITVIMLGPGTTISHRAMELIGDVGVGVAISTPAFSITVFVISRENFPEPKIKRELNSFPPIINLSLFIYHFPLVYKKYLLTVCFCQYVLPF